MLIPLYTQNHKDSMSFPGISRVLNRFVERVRTQTFFGHPRKNQSRKPNAKSTKPRSNRGEKTTSVIFQRSRLDRKSQRWENTGRTLERRKTLPLFLGGKDRGRPGAPARGTGHGATRPGPRLAPERGPRHQWGSAGWLLRGVEMNSFLSQNTLNGRVGNEGSGKGD